MGILYFIWNPLAETAAEPPEKKGTEEQRKEAREGGLITIQ